MDEPIGFDHIAILGPDTDRRLAKEPRYDEMCVRSVIRGLHAGEGPDQRVLGENLIRVVEEELYKLVIGFPRFQGWVLGAQPNGLQLRDIPIAKRLRRELLAVGLVGAWAEVLPHIVREAGRPKRFVDSDYFNRFFPADRSDTGIDRRIMKLWNDHPEIYDRQVAFKITLAQATAEAGIGRPPKEIQLRALRSAWNKAAPETQKMFLASVLGPEWAS
jgi:hypothetical protein